MKLSIVEQQAIEARMALMVGVEQYDRLFLGFKCTELEGDILFVDALDEPAPVVSSLSHRSVSGIDVG
jgi:hypothetical protein